MDGYITEEYVRKDVYEANLKSIERLMSANMARHEMLNEQIRGELKTMNTRIDALNTRMDDLKDAQSHNLAYWGIAAALFVGAVQVVVSLVLNFWK